VIQIQVQAFAFIAGIVVGAAVGALAGLLFCPGNW